LLLVFSALQSTENAELPEMTDEIDTLYLQECVQRWQGGDAAAADSLVRAVGQRLEHLTRKMLRNFPAVRASTETADVMQSSLLRLLNTLRQLQPQSTPHFFSLAAVHVRRELLDLARHFRRPSFARPLAAASDASTNGDPIQDAAQTEDKDLELWCRFHETVERLASEEREVVGLVFYHGWTQVQIAELLQVDERTVRRRWQSACLRLQALLGDQLPQA
jgi:RNA polymerase sigma-70 factor (ECF subfamily)